MPWQREIDEPIKSPCKHAERSPAKTLTICFDGSYLYIQKEPNLLKIACGEEIRNLSIYGT